MLLLERESAPFKRTKLIPATWYRFDPPLELGQIIVEDGTATDTLLTIERGCYIAFAKGLHVFQAKSDKDSGTEYLLFFLREVSNVAPETYLR
jgi:hypothetical protein